MIKVAVAGVVLTMPSAFTARTMKRYVPGERLM